MVSRHVLGQQDEVPTGPVNDVGTPLTVHRLVIIHRMATTPRTICLHTHDGLEAFFLLAII